MAYVKSELGQKTFKDRSVPLTPRQRAAFILFDGKRSLADVLAATAGLGVVADDIEHMVRMGLLEENSDPPAAAPAAAPAESTLTPQERYQRAYPIAIQLTSSLGLRGFRLNLAVEGTTSYEQLLELAPRIREAVGADKCKALEAALKGL